MACLWRLIGPEVRSAARRIVDNPDDPTSDNRSAVERAVIEANQRYVELAVMELDRLQKQGKIDEQAALERGRRRFNEP